MALSLLQTDTFRSLMRDHLFNTIAYLLEAGQEFAVAAEVEYLDSDPELPRSITRGFGEVALFVLQGYTFETATLDEEYLYFEAGFGEENIGAHVILPLLSIKQIFIDEYPIALNIISPAPYAKTPIAAERSMEALLSNPENQKLIKDNKK